MPKFLSNVDTAAKIINVPAGGIAATNVQAALNELDGDKQAVGNELTALQALADTAGFVKKTGDGAYAIDASTYGTSNLAVANMTGTAMTLGGSVAHGSAASAARSDHKHAITNPSIESLAAATDVTTLNASTTAHGLAPKAVAPAASVLNVLGIANGETAFSNKVLFDASNPAMNGSVAPGTSLQAAHDDHVHPVDTSREASIGAKNTAFNKNYGTTATDVKINGTQGVGSIDAIARIDHVHPVDTGRQAALGYTPAQFKNEVAHVFTSGATTHVVTDAFITAATLVIVSPTQAKIGSWSVVSAAGSFTITSTATETSNVNFDWGATK